MAVGPRLIMIYLQSEAIRTQSREILLGRSLREWLSKMGIPVGGKSLKDVRDQCERISRCRLSLAIRHGSQRWDDQPKRRRFGDVRK